MMHLALLLYLYLQNSERQSWEASDALYQTHYRADRYQEALEVLRAMRGRAERENDLKRLTRALGRTGVIYSDLGDYSQAVAHLTRAVALSRQTGDRGAEQSYRANLGLAYVFVGRYPEALEECQLALTISREIGNRLSEGRNLGLIAGIHNEMAEYHQAVDKYTQAIAIAREVGDRSSEADQQASLGEAYLALGDPSRALDSVRTALELARSRKNPWLEGRFLEVLGSVQMRLRNRREALESYQKGLDAARKVGDKLGVATRLGLMATAYEQLGETARSLEHHHQALAIATEIGAVIAEGRIRNQLGNLYVRLRDWEAARKSFESALALGERTRMPEVVWRASNGLARTEQALSRPEQAVCWLRRSIDAVEQVRAGLLAAEDKAGFLEDKIEVYQRMIGLLVALHREDEAFHYAERASARAFLDSLGESAGIGRLPEPQRLEQAQRLLDSDSVLLKYSLGREGSFLFVVTSTKFKVVRLPSAAAIAREVGALRNAVARPSRESLGSYLLSARALYKDLIQPAGALLSSKRELIIVPDGVLHSLPFELLVKPEGALAQPDLARLPYLIRTASIRYAPSTSVLAALDARGSTAKIPEKGFLAFADPDYGAKFTRLAQSHTEAAEIAKLYPAGQALVMEGESASEENVKREGLLRQYAIVHFAAHGLLNENKPRYSGLALSSPQSEREDGLLHAYEILNLKLNARLVVLSACETGLGKKVQGEGLVGLTRAFLYAGSSAVIASLWKVEDRSTANLMIQFHRRLREGRFDTAEALRRAKLDLIDGGAFSHPYYWAPFVLSGLNLSVESSKRPDNRLAASR